LFKNDVVQGMCVVFVSASLLFHVSFQTVSRK